MYMKHKSTGNLVEIMDATALADPCRSVVSGRFHVGEELQDAVEFAKQDLVFPSGEALPRCWQDASYRAK